MSLKSSLLALANNIGMCQENARSIKQALAGGLAEVAVNASGIDGTADCKKLWNNEHPTDAFPATDVTVDNTDDFDAFIVVYSLFSWSGMSLWYINKAAINDNSNHSIFHNYLDNTNGIMIKSTRSMKLTQAADSTSLKFEFAGANRDTLSTYGSAATSTANNSNMIPQYIIGIKF